MDLWNPEYSKKNCPKRIWLCDWACLVSLCDIWELLLQTPLTASHTPPQRCHSWDVATVACSQQRAPSRCMCFDTAQHVCYGPRRQITALQWEWWMTEEEAAALCFINDDVSNRGSGLHRWEATKMCDLAAAPKQRLFQTRFVWMDDLTLNEKSFRSSLNYAFFPLFFLLLWYKKETFVLCCHCYFCPNSAVKGLWLLHAHIPTVLFP